MRKFFLKLKNNDFIMKSLFVYLVTICIVLSSVLSIISISYKHSIGENEKFNHYIFENILVSVKETVTSIQYTQSYLLKNKELMEICEYDVKNYFSNQLTYDVLDDFKSYKQLSTNIDMFFVYLKNTDCILYDGGIVSTKSFYDICFKSEGVSYDEWIASFEDISSPRYSTSYLLSNSNEVVTCLSYSFRMGSSESIGCILSSKYNLIKNVEHINWAYACDIFVYNPYNKLVVSQTTDSFDGPLPTDISDIFAYQNSHHTVFSDIVTIGNNHWKVYAVIDKIKLNHNLNKLMTKTAIVLLLLISLLMYVISYFIKNSVKPLKSLFTFVFSTNDESDYSMNELLDSLKTTFTEKETLESNIFDTKKSLEKTAILNLFRENFEGYFLNEYVPEFSGNHFMVASFELSDISNLFKEDELSNEQRKNYLHFIVKNIFSELFASTKYTSDFYEVDSNYVCLLNAYEEFDISAVKHVLEKGIRIINANFNIDLVYMLSASCQGIYNISLAYSQIVKSINHRNFFELDTPIVYSEVFESVSNNADAFDSQIGQELINSIRGMDRDNTFSIIDAIFQKLLNNGTILLERAKYVITDVLVSTSRVADIQEDKLYDTHIAIQKCNSINQLKEIITMHINMICDTIEQNYLQSKSKLSIPDVIVWAEKNYTNPNVNISVASEHFEVSTKYFSKMFKNGTNKSFVDYINALRVEKTMDIIKTEGLPVEKAAIMAGFTNKQTYYRVRKNFNK